MSDLTAFIAGLPKAELHVHHVGSASPRIVAELAARHPDSQVPVDPEELKEFFTFTDFAHFIEVYLAVVDLLRDADDVRLLTYEVAADLARQQVRYAELTVTPYSSTSRGIPAGAFLEAIEDARRQRRKNWASSCAGPSTSLARPGCRRLRRPPVSHRNGTRRVGLLRARRTRNRRSPPAVQAVLRSRDRLRTAQRAARGRDHRPGDGLGRAQLTACRAHRTRHQRRT